METRKYEGKIQDNYDKYLKEPIRIGFMESFPVTKVLDSVSIKTKCRSFDVNVNVNLCECSFGKDREFIAICAVTDIVDISKYLPVRGFASGCCYDEAETMEAAIVEFCKQKDLMICKKENSWPFAKAHVSQNIYKN